MWGITAASALQVSRFERLIPPAAQSYCTTEQLAESQNGGHRISWSDVSLIIYQLTTLVRKHNNLTLDADTVSALAVQHMHVCIWMNEWMRRDRWGRSWHRSPWDPGAQSGTSRYRQTKRWWTTSLTLWWWTEKSPPNGSQQIPVTTSKASV